MNEMADTVELEKVGYAPTWEGVLETIEPPLIQRLRLEPGDTLVVNLKTRIRYPEIELSVLGTDE